MKDLECPSAEIETIAIPFQRVKRKLNRIFVAGCLVDGKTSIMEQCFWRIVPNWWWKLAGHNKICQAVKETSDIITSIR